MHNIKPKIWVLADSRVGNVNQAIALAEKLGLGYQLKPIEYNFWGKLPNFLLALSPIHVKKQLLQSWEMEGFPDLIISAGRRTASLASYLKHKSAGIVNSGEFGARSDGATPISNRRATSNDVPNFSSIDYKVKIVQIMHPNLPFKQFDLIILPHHDKVSKEELCMNDKNMLRITGALNNVQAKIQAGGMELRKNYPYLKQFISVIIGGNSKNYQFTDENAGEFAAILSNLTKTQDEKYILFISFSRRTPNSAKQIIKNKVPSSAIIYDPTEEEAKPNPYFGMLAQADYIISTADSISMCSEAASTGKPLYIFCPSNFKSPKHLAFTQNLLELGIAKILDKSVIQLENYNYTPLNEVEKIANIIIAKNWIIS